MANIKISDLTSAASVSGTQQFEVNESGTSKKVTGAQIAAYVEGEVSSSPSFTGQVSNAAGSAAAPSITVTGDTNTGIHFPAADTVGISTGGTLRVSVDSSGSLVTTGAIELGHASDTTLSRVSTGVIAVEGITVPLNSVTNTHTAQQIELGHASDTTISRVSGGVIAVEGGVIPKENRDNTFTLPQTISTAASQALFSFTANAGVAKTIQFLTGANSRWVVASENTAESGANAGSNFIINNYNDAGAYLSTPFQITRSTGNVGIGVTPTAKLHVLDLFDGNKTICSFNNISNVSTATAASIDLVADQSWVRFTTTRDGAGTSAALTISPTVAGTPTDRLRIDTSGNILNVSSGGLGYGTGSGGGVTQLTSKTTAVTVNKTNGYILTSNSALGGGASATFTVLNSTFAASDNVVLNSTNANYSARVANNNNGSFTITLKNETGGSLSNAVQIQFAIIKSVFA